MNVKSIKNILFYSFMVFLLYSCSHEQSAVPAEPHEWELEAVWDFSNSVYSPVGMWQDHQGNLVIHDIGDDKTPVKIFNENYLEYSISSGQGPGEISERLNKAFSEHQNNSYLYDRGNKRLLKFDNSYRFLGDVEDEILNDGTLYVSGFYSDSLMFTFSADPLVRISNAGGKDLAAIRTTDYDFLEPLQNFLLVQAPFYAVEEDDIYYALEYSSLIMHIDSDNNFSHTFGPDSIGVPVVDNKDGLYRIPRMGDQREGLRDIRVQGDYLYAILNGETYGKRIQIRYRNDFESLIEIARHGQTLLIYNRHTLEFLKAVELPVAASKMSITDEKLYLLNYIDSEPAVYVYKNTL